MSDIKVRVGQQNAVKVVSSISGSSISVTSENVIGGIASVRSLIVSGVSTFVGVSTFNNDVFGKDFYTNRVTVSGIISSTGGIYYKNFSENGMAYFNSSGILTSTQSPQNSINYTNSIMTIDNSNIPSWSTVIDGGSY